MSGTFADFSENFWHWNDLSDATFNLYWKGGQLASRVRNLFFVGRSFRNDIRMPDQHSSAALLRFLEDAINKRRNNGVSESDARREPSRFEA